MRREPISGTLGCDTAAAIPVDRWWGEVEIRRYPAHTLAKVVIDGVFDEAGNRGFRPLFGYIQGQTAKTAPVGQTPGEAGTPWRS